MLHRIWLLCTLVVTAGCAEMVIEGQLLDAQGNSIEGAMVTSVGTQCAATTDTKGRYELTCPPGSHELVMSKQGFLTEELQVNAAERQRYKVGKKVLVAIPEEQGLFLFANDAYLPMKSGQLVRKLSGEGMSKQRAYCLDKTRSEPNPTGPGEALILDNAATTWRPFRLDSEGCAYRDSRNKRGSWVVDYREKPDLEEHKLTGRMKLARIQLTPGEYFIADWKGFFVSQTEDQQSYGGFWITVER
jgi:hypothetical protein